MHFIEESQRSGLKLINLGLKLVSGGGTLARLSLGDKLAERGNLLADLASLLLVELLLILLESLLGVVQHAVGTVGTLNDGLALTILRTVLLSILNHVLDLVVGETGAGSNGDGLVLARGLVSGVDVDDGIGVDVEGDLNLRHTTVGRGYSNKLEVAKELVISDKLTLTLVDLDLDSSLEVGSSGEHLRLLGGDGGVAVDETGEDTAKGLNTEGKRSDIEEQDISDLTREDGTLDGSTNGDSLIGVDGLGRVASEDGLDGLGDLGHTSHTTDQDNLLDVLGLQVGILECLADGSSGAGDERVSKGLELSTGHLGVDVLGTGGVSGDEGKVDVSLEGGRQLNLGLFSGLADTLDGHAVARQVNARLLFELLHDVADESDVEVLTTKVGVTVGGLDLENTLGDLKDGDIKGTTAKIVDGDDTVGLLLKTIGKGSSGRLVHDTENVETGNLASVLGGLTLGVVEVGRDSDNTILDGLAKVGLGGLLHLLEDEATNLGGRVLLALSLKPGVAVGVLDNLEWHLSKITLDLTIGELATDETLGGKERVLRVDNSLAFGGNTDKSLTLLGEGNNGWGGTGTWSCVSQPACG